MRDEDRFGCVWGRETNGRPDPQPLARIAMGQAEPDESRAARIASAVRESIAENQNHNPRPTQRGGNAVAWMVLAIVAVLIGAAGLIAWRIFV